MEDNAKKIVLKALIKELELPDGAYEKAVNRYTDIGDWLSRDESLLKDYDPHVFSQGSFRLGTAIKPVSNEDEYDLDLACKLRNGVSKASHSQEELKKMIGKELELYRKARNIQEGVKEKHRCWRIEYQDGLKFHIDIVPCIPESKARVDSIYESLTKSGADVTLARSCSDTTISITDDRTLGYKTISDDWNISNPEGYAKWFEQTMRRKTRFDLMEKAAQVDDVPLYKRKTPLQIAVQLLKKHRDIMFAENLDSKPISIIITTLVARAYNGETDISDLMDNIFQKIPSLVSSEAPRIPNPVDNAEDFSDRWIMPKYAHLKLEDNFWSWYEQAKADLTSIENSSDASFITKMATAKFGIHLDEDSLRKSLGGSSSNKRVPTSHTIKNESKPWRMEDK